MKQSRVSPYTIIPPRTLPPYMRPWGSQGPTKKTKPVRKVVEVETTGTGTKQIGVVEETKTRGGTDEVKHDEVVKGDGKTKPTEGVNNDKGVEQAGVVGKVEGTKQVVSGDPKRIGMIGRAVKTREGILLIPSLGDLSNK